MSPRRHSTVTSVERRELWRRYKAGETILEIGRALSQRPSNLYRVLQATGGIAPQKRTRSPRVLGFGEREEISRGIAADKTFRAIARSLNRAVTGCFRCCWMLLGARIGGLKIRVSVVQFHSWPPFKSIFQIKKLRPSALHRRPLTYGTTAPRFVRATHPERPPRVRISTKSSCSDLIVTVSASSNTNVVSAMGTGDTRAGVWLMRMTASCIRGHSSAALDMGKAISATPSSALPVPARLNRGAVFVASSPAPRSAMPRTPIQTARAGLAAWAMRAKRVRGSVGTCALLRTYSRFKLISPSSGANSAARS